MKQLGKKRFYVLWFFFIAEKFQEKLGCCFKLSMDLGQKEERPWFSQIWVQCNRFLCKLTSSIIMWYLKICFCDEFHNLTIFHNNKFHIFNSRINKIIRKNIKSAKPCWKIWGKKLKTRVYVWFVEIFRNLDKLYPRDDFSMNFSLFWNCG